MFESGETREHINMYGGEERFWLGPEGGQYSLFFKNGVEFNLNNWYVPRLIDLEPFQVIEKTKISVLFTKNASFTNYAGFQFDIGIERKVEVLSSHETFDYLRVVPLEDVKSIAYLTTNTVSNDGEKNWEKETGLLSIWLLGMFNRPPQ